MLGILIILVVVGTFIIGILIGAQPMKKESMHQDYMDAEKAERHAREIIAHHERFVCPWCRKRKNYPVGYGTGQEWLPALIFCPDCQEEIRMKMQSDFRPDFVYKDDYKNLQNDFRFWVIQKDYERGDIDKLKAGELIRQFYTPPKKDCWPPRIKPKYNPHSEAIQCRNIVVPDWYDNGDHERRCGCCCRPSHECECRKNYDKGLEDGLYPPKDLLPYLNEIMAIDPNYRVQFYFRLNDWKNLQAIKADINRGGYTNEQGGQYIREYLQVIITDLEVWVEFWYGWQRGENPPVPILPSCKTDPDSVEAQIYSHREHVYPGPLYVSEGDQVLGEFLQKGC